MNSVLLNFGFDLSSNLSDKTILYPFNLWCGCVRSTNELRLWWCLVVMRELARLAN